MPNFDNANASTNAPTPPSLSETDANRRKTASQPGSPAALLLAGAAIGAAVSYLFDAANGASRRAVLRDKAASLLRSAGRDVNARARDVKNRAQGAVAETRTRFGDESVEDEQLAARVRAALGHHIDRVRPIEVVAEGGHVILRGQAPESEIETAVAAARTVRGVAGVENCLQPLPTTEERSDVDRSAGD